MTCHTGPQIIQTPEMLFQQRRGKKTRLRNGFTEYEFNTGFFKY